MRAVLLKKNFHTYIKVIGRESRHNNGLPQDQSKGGRIRDLWRIPNKNHAIDFICLGRCLENLNSLFSKVREFFRGVQNLGF